MHNIILFRLHFLFYFFKKNIQDNNYGSDVHSEKKQRKKKRGSKPTNGIQQERTVICKIFFIVVLWTLPMLLHFVQVFFKCNWCHSCHIAIPFIVVTFNNDLYQVSSFFPLSFSILFFYHHLATPMNCDFGWPSSPHVVPLHLHCLVV